MADIKIIPANPTILTKEEIKRDFRGALRDKLMKLAKADGDDAGITLHDLELIADPKSTGDRRLQSTDLRTEHLMLGGEPLTDDPEQAQAVLDVLARTLEKNPIEGLSVDRGKGVSKSVRGIDLPLAQQRDDRW